MEVGRNCRTLREEIESPMRTVFLINDTSPHIESLVVRNSECICLAKSEKRNRLTLLQACNGRMRELCE